MTAIRAALSVDFDSEPTTMNNPNGGSKMKRVSRMSLAGLVTAIVVSMGMSVGLGQSFDPPPCDNCSDVHIHIGTCGWGSVRDCGTSEELGSETCSDGSVHGCSEDEAWVKKTINSYRIYCQSWCCPYKTVCISPPERLGETCDTGQDCDDSNTHVTQKVLIGQQLIEGCGPCIA